MSEAKSFDVDDLEIIDSGLTLKSLQVAYHNGGTDGVVNILGEDVNGRPRVTKQKKVVDQIIAGVKISLGEEINREVLSYRCL